MYYLKKTFELAFGVEITFVHCLYVVFVFQSSDQGVYYRSVKRGKSSTLDAALDAVSDSIQTITSDSDFQAQWALVATWWLMEYPGSPSKVRHSWS